MPARGLRRHPFHAKYVSVISDNFRPLLGMADWADHFNVLIQFEPMFASDLGA